MQKFLLSFLLVIACAAGKAQISSVYDQLVSVNPGWKNQTDAGPELKTTAPQTLNEQQLIQLHLSETEKLLRSRDISRLSTQARQNRKSNLDVLHRYLLAGLFPVNTLHSNRQPYFIDQYNTYCAVGYLMKESGADAMAKDIERTQNYSYLKDIQHPQLLKWVQQSGLSLDELALIQPGYPGDWTSAIMEFHYNNAGTDVNEYIEVHQSTMSAGMTRFSSVLFYDLSGTLYKTLPIAEMQVYSTGFGPVYYYLFPANESFADQGKIELRGNIPAANTLIASTVYTGTSVRVTDYYPNPANPSVRIFPVGENESTPANYSLTYCGFYYDAGWRLQNTLATNGTQNPCIVMPIALKSFSSSVDGKAVNLSWETAAEMSSRHFIVERSVDGVNFEAIGTVAAAGNSSSARQYAFTDAAPRYINHYRLRFVDMDGKFLYSKILYVNVDKASPLRISENVVNTRLLYEVIPVQAGSTIQVYDFTGRSMYKAAVKAPAQHIDLSGWSAGKYIIRLLTTEGIVYTQQFIKQ